MTGSSVGSKKQQPPVFKHPAGFAGAAELALTQVGVSVSVCVGGAGEEGRDCTLNRRPSALLPTFTTATGLPWAVLRVQSQQGSQGLSWAVKVKTSTARLRETGHSRFASHRSNKLTATCRCAACACCCCLLSAAVAAQGHARATDSSPEHTADRDRRASQGQGKGERGKVCKGAKGAGRGRRGGGMCAVSVHFILSLTSTGWTGFSEQHAGQHTQGRHQDLMLDLPT